MGVVKVIELIGESRESWDDAAMQALQRANETIENIKGMDVKKKTAKIEEGEIKKYKTTVKIAFVVEDVSK